MQTHELIAVALVGLSKVAVVYIAYLAAREHILHAGWFVFFAIVYGLSGFRTGASE
jgi:hypothetical protein